MMRHSPAKERSLDDAHTYTATDTTTDAANEAGHSARSRQSWAVLAVALTAQILVVLDISVVNTDARSSLTATSSSGWSPPI